MSSPQWWNGDFIEQGRVNKVHGIRKRRAETGDCMNGGCFKSQKSLTLLLVLLTKGVFEGVLEADGCPESRGSRRSGQQGDRPDRRLECGQLCRR